MPPKKPTDRMAIVPAVDELVPARFAFLDQDSGTWRPLALLPAMFRRDPINGLWTALIPSDFANCPVALPHRAVRRQIEQEFLYRKEEQYAMNGKYRLPIPIGCHNQQAKDRHISWM
jgi:hypothetical protein